MIKSSEKLYEKSDPCNSYWCCSNCTARHAGCYCFKSIAFNYSALSPVSFIIYFIVAFVITKRTNRKTAILSSAFLGLFDGTVGWKLSLLLNANVGNLKIEITPALIIMTVVFMTLLAAIFGLLGSLLAAVLSKNK